MQLVVNPRSAANLWAAVAMLLSALHLLGSPFQLVSTTHPSQIPAGGGGDSITPALSSDGRYVLFASAANNLGLLSGTNPIPRLFPPRLNVFLRDRTNGTTTLVSVNAIGTGGGNGDSYPTGISTDGRYACFESSASDLVASDTNGVTDVFVRDLLLGTNFLISVGTDDAIGNGVCRGSTMTPDGRFVAFVSAATNLVVGDSNGIPDIFVRDLQNNVTLLASVGALGTNLLSRPPNSSESPDITPDGRYVAFYSTATNLIPTVTTTGELYVRDLIGGTTTWASAGARGAAQAVFGTSNAVSCNHLISADGITVTYEVTKNTAGFPHGDGIILRYRSDTGLTDIINTNAFAPAVAYEDFRSLDMTPDGRFIAFVANTNGITDATTCILLWDAQSGNTTLVSIDLNGNVATNSTCDSPAIDQSGRYVAFISNAPNLVTNALVGEYHLYVRDVQTGVTVVADAGMDGTGSSVGPATYPRLSADGRFVAFEALDANLVPNDRNRDYDVFVRDLVSNTVEMISAHHPSLPSASPNGPSAISSYSVSDDGRYVAFSSEADNLTSNDTNAMRDIFVRDRQTGTNILVSANQGGGVAHGLSAQPVISGNGRYVAFSSTADDLVSAKTSSFQDIILHDLLSGTNALVSLNSSGTHGGNSNSYSPWISADGKRVLFRSTARDLVSASFTGENLFLRDMSLGKTYALTTNGFSAAAISRNGRYAAFINQNSVLSVWDSQTKSTVWSVSSIFATVLAVTSSGNKVIYSGTSGLKSLTPPSFDLLLAPVFSRSHGAITLSQDDRFVTYAGSTNLGSTASQVYFYDLQAGGNSLVSHAYGSTSFSSGNADVPIVTSDGKFIAFRSTATNLLSTTFVTNNGANVYMYNRLNGTSSLLTASTLTGMLAEGYSFAPSFSADGGTLVVEGWASDVAPQDYNRCGDVLALPFLHASISRNTTGIAPTIFWPARPGETYQVLFKNALTDSIWQNVAGSVTITNGMAQLIDANATSAQRFYRVAAQ
jgi:hypothetical protein